MCTWKFGNYLEVICCRSRNVTCCEHVMRTPPESWRTREFGSCSFALWCNHRVVAVENVCIHVHVYMYMSKHVWTTADEIHVCELVWRYAVVTPLHKAASYEPRIAILGIWGDTWLTRGKYGIYVAVRGSYGVYVTPSWKWREISKCCVSYVAGNEDTLVSAA